MLVPYVCPYCGTRGTVSQDMLGKTIRCLECGAEILIKETGADKAESIMVLDGDDLAVDSGRDAQIERLYKLNGKPPQTQTHKEAPKQIEEYDADELAVDPAKAKQLAEQSKARIVEALKLSASTTDENKDSDESTVDVPFYGLRQEPNGKAPAETGKILTKPIEESDEIRIEENMKPCPHCGSMISAKAKICKYCSQEVDFDFVQPLNFTTAPQEDLFKQKNVPAQQKFTRAISYLRVLGALFIFVSIFLPWFASVSGLDLIVNKPAANSDARKILEAAPLANNFALPVASAIVVFSIIILVLEFVKKSATFLLAVMPFLFALILFFLFKDAQYWWARMNFGLAMFILGAILEIIPGRKIFEKTQ